MPYRIGLSSPVKSTPLIRGAAPEPRVIPYPWVLLRLPPLTVIAWTYIFGGLGILLVTFPHLVRFPFREVPPIGYAGMTYIILIPTILCYFLNTWAIKKSTPSLVATYITLQPVAATLLAAVFLGESLGLKEVAGFLLIVAGLYAVSYRSVSG